MPQPLLTHDDYVVNIIIKVMYLSQGCATYLYGSVIVSLSFYYILLIDLRGGLYVLDKAPVRVLYGKYSTRGGVKKFIKHEA